MSNLSSGNGAVLASDAARAPEFAAVNRMQLPQQAENDAIRCKTLHTPDLEIPEAAVAADVQSDVDEPYSLTPERYDADGEWIPDLSESLLRKVSIKQLTAIGVLLHGDDLQKAAELAKVHRSTLYRWLKFDADFQAELQAQQRAMYDLALSRAIVAVGDAMDQVVGAADKGDLQAAIQLLKGMGILTGRRPNFNGLANPPHHEV